MQNSCFYSDTTMQINKNRTKRKQYLVCHESAKKSPGMEKVKNKNIHDSVGLRWERIGGSEVKKMFPMSY